MAKKKVQRAKRGGRSPGQWVDLTREQVLAFRKSAKLSRAKLAELLGVSSTSIQNWETGRAVPLRRYQQQLVELMRSGPPSSSGGRQPPGARPSTPELEVARLTVTGEILKAYLATAQGGKVSQEQLLALARSLRASLA